MAGGDLNGSGPYVGLPSYYGGLYPLALAGFAQLGLSPTTAVAALSWFEPLFWILAALVAARGIWPSSVFRRYLFCAFITLAAGIALPPRQQWVWAPNLAGQVFWPLYPRDVAIMLLLVAVGLALRGRPFWAGLAVAAAICTEAQVGVMALCLGIVAVALSPRKGPRRVSSWRYKALGLVGVASVASAWWWMPRVIWALEWGLDLGGGAGRDLPPLAILAGCSLLVPLAVVGTVQMLRWRGRRGSLFVLVWLLIALLTLAFATLPGGDLITVRRALVLMGLPISALAAEGAVAAGALLRVQRVRASALAGALAAAVAALSLPVLLDTRSHLVPKFGSQRYSSLVYTTQQWEPVWSQLRHAPGPVLAPPGDAAMAWFMTGQPELYVPRPGFLKAGFSVAKATGWSEQSRASTVRDGFAGGASSLCSVARQHGAGAVMVRSMPGLLGDVDMTGKAMARLGTASQGSALINANGRVELQLPPGGSVTVSLPAFRRIRAFDVWQRRAVLTTAVDGRVISPAKRVHAGATRTHYVFTSQGFGTLTLTNHSDATVILIRLVGYEPAAVSAAPATVVTPSVLCRLTGAG